MGGTDDPSNLVELTIEEHAEAHRVLWEEHGHWQDELAWKGLSGQIGKEEMTIEAVKRANTGRKHTPEHNRRISESKKGMVFTEAHKKALSEAQLKSKNHAKRGKKDPKHSELMSGYKYRKEPCTNCGMMVGVNIKKRHESVCTL